MQVDAQSSEQAKRCSGCKRVFPMGSFHENGRGYKVPHCKTCVSRENRIRYRRGEKKQIDTAKSRYEEARAKLWKLKAEPCNDCKGLFPPVAMEYDHRDPSTKSFGISTGSDPVVGDRPCGDREVRPCLCKLSQDSRVGAEAMIVDAKRMWSAVKNASLFCRQKTWNGGEARFEFYEGQGTITASDDFVTIVTSFPVDYDRQPKQTYYFSAKAVKATEQHLRTETGELSFFVDSECSTTPAEPEWWAGLDNVLQQLGDRPATVASWELNPERLTLLSRLEPKGEYPLSWKPFRVDDDWLWGLKYGPDTFGLVVPLSRDDLDLDDRCLWHRGP